MPRIEVIRKGITPAVRPVPTDTTLAILPMTLDRVGKEVEDEDEQPVRIDSVNDAFEKFKPAIRFETLAGAVSAVRGSRVAVTTTDSSMVVVGGGPEARLSSGSAALAPSGKSASTKMDMRMIWWPIIATNVYPCKGFSIHGLGATGW